MIIVYCDNERSKMTLDELKKANHNVVVYTIRDNKYYHEIVPFNENHVVRIQKMDIVWTTKKPVGIINELKTFSNRS